MDIGPGTSHKAKIVELYLKGYEFTDIKRNIRHSSDSIARYLKDFAKVSALHNEGYSIDQIRQITGHFWVHAKYETIDEICLYPSWEVFCDNYVPRCPDSF